MKAANKTFLTPTDLEQMGLWSAKNIYNRVNHLKNFPIPFHKLDQKAIRFKAKDVEEFLESRRITQS